MMSMRSCLAVRQGQALPQARSRVTKLRQDPVCLTASWSTAAGRGRQAALYKSHHMFHSHGQPQLASWPRTAILSDQAPVDNPADPSAAEAVEQDAQPFAWTKAWYAVAVVGELDPTRPKQITLLGEDYVLWKDGSGAWRAFADRCPHRLAPLSEGRIEADGTLLCAYHAWRFDGGGACTRIPQARNETEEQSARRNPRACATAFPVRVEQGLLWLWPESGPVAEAESQASQPPLIPELGQPKVVRSGWRSHELPYSQDYFYENVLDPAHAVVAHHGMVGNRYTDPGPIAFKVLEPLSRDKGFVFQAPSARVKGGIATTTFVPPNCARISTANPDGSTSTLHLYASPSRPGFNTQIGCQVFIPNAQGKYNTGIKVFQMPLPEWLFHVLGALFLHQDAVFLHQQERTVATSAYKNTRAVDRFYVPTSSDKMVLTYRRWFERYSPNGIPYGGEFAGHSLPQAERDHNKLFDTWTSHTQNCVVCKRALARLKVARVVSWVVCALAAVQGAVTMASGAAAQAAAASVGSAQPSLLVPWLWAGLVALSAGVAAALSKLISMFYTMPFSHADNN